MNRLTPTYLRFSTGVNVLYTSYSEDDEHLDIVSLSSLGGGSSHYV